MTTSDGERDAPKDKCAQSSFFTFTPRDDFLAQHKNDLFQQFFIIGLDYPDIQKLYDYEGSSMKEFIMKSKIRPKVISKYPPYDLDYIHIPDSIVASHCCPNFFELIPETNLQVKDNEEKFHFSLENFTNVFANIKCEQTGDKKYRKKYSEIYHKVYYSCILFYEELNEYDQYFKQKSNGNKKQHICVGKILCLNTFLPFQKEAISILKKIRKYVKIKSIQSPVEKLIERLIFDIPSLPKGFKFFYDFFGISGIQYEFSRSVPNKLPNSSLDMEILPCYFSSDVIMRIFKAILLEFPIIFFHPDKYILSSIIEVFVTLLYPFEYRKTLVHILPKDNYSLIEKLDCYIVGINEKFNASFMENNNLVSYNKNILFVDIRDKRRTVICVLEPHKDEPEILLNSQRDRYKPLEHVSPADPFGTIELPIHYTSKTMEKIKKKFQIFERKQSTNKRLAKKRTVSIQKVQSDDETFNDFEIVEDPEDFNSGLQSIFYYYFVCLFLEMKNYYNIEDEKDENKKGVVFKQFTNLKAIMNLEEVFNSKKFIRELPLLDVPFFEKFCNSQMFKQFIISRRFPLSYDDIDTHLLFDETVIQKMNRKAFSRKGKTFFLEHEFSMKNALNFNSEKKFIKFCSNLFELSPEETNALKALKESDKNNKLYQNITVSKDIDRISFSYSVFPMLIVDKHLTPIYSGENNFYNMKTSIDSNAKQDVVDKIKKFEKYYYDFYEDNRETIASYYYIEDKSPYEMFDFTSLVKLLWLKLFIKRFKNIKIEEREDVFMQMIFVVKQFLWIPQDVFDSIFYVIYKYGTYSQLISLYNYFNQNLYKFSVLLKDKCAQAKLKEKELKEQMALIAAKKAAKKEKESKLEFTFNFLSKLKCMSCNDTISLNEMYSTNNVYYCSKCQNNYFGDTLLIIHRDGHKQISKCTFEIFPITSLLEELEESRCFYDLYPNNLPRSKIFSCIFYLSYCQLPTKFLVQEKDLFRLSSEEDKKESFNFIATPITPKNEEGKEDEKNEAEIEPEDTPYEICLTQEGEGNNYFEGADDDFPKFDPNRESTKFVQKARLGNLMGSNNDE